MPVERISYADTRRFATPVLDHLADEPFVRQFLELPPSLTGTERAAAGRSFDPGYRTILCNALDAQHSDLQLYAEVRASLRKLRDPQCLTITTGHQLCIFTGPLYVPYKILNTIRLAREAEARLRRPVVPVFWMASEDHDAAEIDHADINGRSVRWSGASGGA
ncbi:MAG: bacillithiol biosynthesis protein BshC, partial [Flavobacteriales bacterium]